MGFFKTNDQKALVNHFQQLETFLMCTSSKLNTTCDGTVTYFQSIIVQLAFFFLYPITVTSILNIDLHDNCEGSSRRV